MRKLSAAVLAGVLILSVSACGQSTTSTPSSSTSASQSSQAPAGTGSLDADVTIEVKDSGKADPGVSLKQGLAAVEKTQAKKVQDGTGAAVKEGQNLSLRIGFYDTSKGEAIQNSAYTTARTIPLTESAFTGMEAAYTLLKDAKVGATIVAQVPASVTGSAEQLMVINIEGASDAPKKASAAEVKKLKDAGALPTVTFAKDGKPTIKIPAGKDAPNDLVVDVIKEGKGTAAKATSKVTAKYLGVTWKEGKKFDSSYDRSPNTSDFGLNEVIAGWTQGLTGIKEGSTVVLSIPSSMAYGDNATNGAAGPLVFVVEIDKVS